MRFLILVSYERKLYQLYFTHFDFYYWLPRGKVLMVFKYLNTCSCLIHILPLFRHWNCFFAF